MAEIGGITGSDITKVSSTKVSTPTVPVKKTVSGTSLLYPDDLPSTIPNTTVTSIDVNNMSKDERITRNRRFFNSIPSKLEEEKRLSTTSAARDCFVYRRNSRKLQETMIDYSYNIVKLFNVTQEV